MLTFILVRHGQTEHNHKAMTMGARIDTPLTETGLANADVLAKKLIGTKFDHVYSSDLGRAFITAHVIVEKLGIESKLTRARQLREIDYGQFTYRFKEEVKKECPQFTNDPDFVFPDGESPRQMQKRAVHFIQKIEKGHPNQTLLIVTHAGVIRALKCHFNEWDYKEHLRMAISHEFIGKFRIDEGKLVSYEKINS
jgi:probable phosphoglycerate mutase